MLTRSFIHFKSREESRVVIYHKFHMSVRSQVFEELSFRANITRSFRFKKTIENFCYNQRIAKSVFEFSL